jgi:hypothetical protein
VVRCGGFAGQHDGVAPIEVLGVPIPRGHRRSGLHRRWPRGGAAAVEVRLNGGSMKEQDSRGSRGA